MANLVKNAGLAARQKLGWWRSHRFLLLRRISQLTILSLFLLGPVWGIWLANDNERTIAIVRGNYSSSLLFDSIPLTDPLILLQSLFAGYWPQMTAMIGGIIVVLIYATLASRLFCGWVCPFNLVTDLAAWLRRRLAIRTNISLSRSLRYAILLAILLGSAISGNLIWEWVNPVALTGRGLINGLSHQGSLLSGLLFGFSAGIWLILAIFIFDLLVVEHGWCGHLCPLGALYALIGQKSLFKVSAEQRKNCDRCMDCFNVCPEAHILRQPVLGKGTSPLVMDKSCLSCGRCIDVCPESVFKITIRLNNAGVNDE